MADSVFPSPLSTKESRDKLLRRPLKKFFDPDMIADRELSTLGKKKSLRSSNKSIATSPEAASYPAAAFATSSPASEVLPDETPGLSIIQGNSPQTPYSNEVIGKRRSKGSKMSVSSQPKIEDDDDDDDDDRSGSQGSTCTETDDDQPSLRVRKSDQSTPNTSRKSNNTLATLKNQGNFIDESLQYSIHEEKSADLLCGCLLPAIVGTIAAICFYLNMSYITGQLSENGIVKGGSFHNQEFWNASMDGLRKDLRLLGQEEFPSQPSYSWIIARSSIKSILKNTPQKPSVILFISDQAGASTSNCLARRIGCKVNQLLKRDTSNCKGVESKSFPKQSDLFQAMNAKLSSPTSSSFTLFNIQDLSGSTAMALHPFCDNEQAPFKQASIVMTLVAPDNVFSQSDSADDIAEKVLNKSWGQDLDVDRVSPLLARVVISAVKVAREPKVSCDG